MKGYKKSNQDRCTAFSYLEGDPELAFFAVYDGHGGTGVANYLKDHLHEFILAQPEYRWTCNFVPSSNIQKHVVGCREGDIPEAILKSFLAVDAELKTYGNATELTGSTGMKCKRLCRHFLSLFLCPTISFGPFIFWENFNNRKLFDESVNEILPSIFSLALLYKNYLMTKLSLVKQGGWAEPSSALNKFF